MTAAGAAGTTPARYRQGLVAVVTARGGSQGFPGKNLAPFLGRPLVAHAVATARAAGIADVICTTDSADIAAAARAEGARTVDRPAELATAHARSIDAVLHAADAVGLPDDTVLVLLQPTSPLRTAADVAESVVLFHERRAGSVVQVAELHDHHPWKDLVDVDGELRPTRSWPDLEAPRQTLPPAYRLTGGIYVATARDLRSQLRFFIPAVVPQVVAPERAVDIDTAADLVVAEANAAALGLTAPV